MLKKSFFIFSSKLASIVLGLILNVVISRALGVEDRGAFAVLLLVPAILSILFRGGAEVSIIHYLKINKDLKTKIFSNSIYLSIFLSIISIVVFSIVNHFFKPAALEKINPDLIKLAAWLTPFEIIYIYISMTFLGIDNFKMYNVSNVITPIINAIILIIVTFNGKINLHTALYTYFLTYIVRLLITIYNLPADLKIPTMPDKNILKNLLSYGVKGYIGNVFDFLILRFDMFIVTTMLGLKATGIYSIAIICERILIIPDSFALATITSQENYDDIQGVLNACNNLNILMSTITVMGILCSKMFFTIVFGKVFSEAWQPFSILMIGYYFLSVTKPIKTYITVKSGTPQISSYGSALALITNIIIIYILVPIWGMNGAAISTTISNLVYSATLVYYFSKKTGISPLKLLSPKKENFLELKAKFLNLKLKRA